MESLGTLLSTAVAVAFLAAVATWLSGYVVSGRYRKARQRLQLMIAEVLRDSGQNDVFIRAESKCKKRGSAYSRAGAGTGAV